MDHIGETDFSAAEVERREPGQAQARPLDDLVDYFRDYARQRPDVVALWAFGIGFLLGWRLKPW